MQERKILPILSMVLAAIAGLIALFGAPMWAVTTAAAFAVLLAVAGIIDNHGQRQRLSSTGLALTTLMALGALALHEANLSLLEPTAPTTELVADADELQAPDSTDLGIGDVVTLGGLQFKVNSLEFVASDGRNRAPDGQHFAVISVTLFNNSAHEIDFNDHHFKLSRNGTLETINTFHSSVENPLTGGHLLTGETITGSLIGTANPGDTLELIYDGHSNWDGPAVTIRLD